MVRPRSGRPIHTTWCMYMCNSGVLTKGLYFVVALSAYMYLSGGTQLHGKVH